MGLPVQCPVSNHDLGKKIVHSAALFETSVAAILDAEAEKLQFVLEHGPCVLGTADLINVLLRINDQISSITCCLKGLEEAIVAKIAAGREIGDF